MRVSTAIIIKTYYDYTLFIFKAAPIFDIPIHINIDINILVPLLLYESPCKIVFKYSTIYMKHR